MSPLNEAEVSAFPVGRAPIGRRNIGWVAMSECDVRRIGTPAAVSADRRTIASAARVVAVSMRQVHRLLQRLDVGGAAASGPPAPWTDSDARTHTGIRDHALAPIREKYADFAPALAVEMLATSLLGRRSGQEDFP